MEIKCCGNGNEWPNKCNDNLIVGVCAHSKSTGRNGLSLIPLKPSLLKCLRRSTDRSAVSGNKQKRRQGPKTTMYVAIDSSFISPIDTGTINRSTSILGKGKCMRLGGVGEVDVRSDIIAALRHHATEKCCGIGMVDDVRASQMPINSIDSFH